MSNQNFRAPAVPLIANDPMFNVYSTADRLTDDTTRHWTGARQYLSGLVSVDGIVYEFLGISQPDNSRYNTGYRKLPQIGCEIRPMTTIYTFQNEIVRLELKFTSPLLLDDLMVMSRPVTYLSYKLTPVDGKEHEIQIYFAMSAEFCVDNGEQEVWADHTMMSTFFTSGTDRMLMQCGDDHRIEWGSFHVVAPGMRRWVKSLRDYQMMVHQKERAKWGRNVPSNYGQCSGPFRRSVEVMARYKKVRVNSCWPCIVAEEDYTLTAEGKSAFLMLCYDDVKSIQYFGENIEAYWRKDGDSFMDMMVKAQNEYAEILARVEQFENQLLKRAGMLSPKYAQIVSLAYRQTISGHKLTWHDGEVQFFSKENYSNGCIATVDVTYPSIPLFLIYNPTLVEGMLNPIFKLVDKGLWNYEFAPHDAGTYPMANGQAYGFGGDYDPIRVQMPVEECGNMILCVAAVCLSKGEYGYFEKHYDILKQWADYLVKTGWDPEHQLCTDDFAGHLAHNVNLSGKAICALAAYARLLRAIGKEEEAAHYDAVAREFAARWEEAAFDGDHYRLAFDQPGTWSIKYNLVWDKLLKLDLFPQKVYDLELAYYKTQMNPYGLPLDNRANYTKSDWQMWSTVLFEDKEYFNMIVDRMWDFLNEAVVRSPSTDWYHTSQPYQVSFQARTVQGGLFINLLKF